jgi:hypothetical protein
VYLVKAIALIAHQEQVAYNVTMDISFQIVVIVKKVIINMDTPK